MQPDTFRQYEGADQIDHVPEATKSNNWFLVRLAIVIAIVIVGIFLVVGSQAIAQESERVRDDVQEEIVPPVNPEGYRNQAAHARWHQLYSKMHNQKGTSCCNAGEEGGDCRPTTARWNAAMGAWEAKLDGTWIVINPSRHVTDAYGLDEFATVCADEKGYLFCFIPPNSGN